MSMRKLTWEGYGPVMNHGSVSPVLRQGIHSENQIQNCALHNWDPLETHNRTTVWMEHTMNVLEKCTELKMWCIFISPFCLCTCCSVQVKMKLIMKTIRYKKSFQSPFPKLLWLLTSAGWMDYLSSHCAWGIFSFLKGKHTSAALGPCVFLRWLCGLAGVKAVSPMSGTPQPRQHMVSWGPGPAASFEKGIGGEEDISYKSKGYCILNTVLAQIKYLLSFETEPERDEL